MKHTNHVWDALPLAACRYCGDGSRPRLISCRHQVGPGLYDIHWQTFCPDCRASGPQRATEYEAAAAWNR